MDIRELTLSEIRNTYKDHIKHDFHADEIKPLIVIERSIKAGKYRCLGAFEDGRMLGYAFFTFNQRDCLLDYFGVLKELRGQGIGTGFLTQLGSSVLKDFCDSLVIEVENPRFATTPEEELILQKRISFYHGCGVIDTGVEARVFGVEYLILEYPLNTPHSTSETAKIYDSIYRSNLPSVIFHANVKIRT